MYFTRNGVNLDGGQVHLVQRAGMPGGQVLQSPCHSVSENMVRQTWLAGWFCRAFITLQRVWAGLQFRGAAGHHMPHIVSWRSYSMHTAAG